MCFVTCGFSSLVCQSPRDNSSQCYSPVLPPGWVSSLPCALLAVWTLVFWAHSFLSLKRLQLTSKPMIHLLLNYLEFERVLRVGFKMRNVQTQGQTWASVSPYADYNEGLIVLTGRREGRGGCVCAATAVQSHSTSPPSGAGQIYSYCLSGGQPSLPANTLNKNCEELEKWNDTCTEFEMMKDFYSGSDLLRCVSSFQLHTAWWKTLEEWHLNTK